MQLTSLENKYIRRKDNKQEKKEKKKKTGKNEVAICAVFLFGLLKVFHSFCGFSGLLIFKSDFFFV